MRETAQLSTCLTGNGTGWQRDAVWGILTLFSQGKIDATDLRILECVAVQGLSLRSARKLLGIPWTTIRNRRKRMALLLGCFC